MQGHLRVGCALLLVVAAATVGLSISPRPANAAGATPPVSPGPTHGDAASIVSPTGSSPTTRATATIPIVTNENTTSRLVLPADSLQTVRFGTVRLDVGGSMAVDNAELHGEYALQRLHNGFAAAEGNTTQRRLVVNRSANRLEARTADLVAREREALQAYNRGQLSTEGYLRELAAIDAAARSLETTLEQLYTYNRAAGMPVAPPRIAQLKAQLVPLRGPVRTAVADTMTGANDRSLRVYVETSTSGFILSLVDERRFSTRYIREAYHGDSFDRQWTDNPITHDEFEDRIADKYPWVWSSNSQLNTVLTGEPYYYRAGIYSIAVNHPQGTDTNQDLEVYYDAGTESVYFEVQRLAPDELPTNRITNASSEGLNITLYTTNNGGPMEVVVTDTATGDPVDATVLLNGTPLGSTTEGRLWTVAPRGNVAVTASQDGRNVTTSVSLPTGTAQTPTPLPNPVEN